jgi:hypothetical protein
VSPDATPWLTRDSVTAVDNSVTAAACFTAGQHNGSQRWAAGPAAAAGSSPLRTRDGRCLALLSKATVASAPGGNSPGRYSH